MWQHNSRFDASTSLTMFLPSFFKHSLREAICYKASHRCYSQCVAWHHLPGPATPVEVTALSPVLVQTPVDITNRQSCQQSHLDDAPPALSVKNSQVCEVLFRLFRLSPLILTTGTADKSFGGRRSCDLPSSSWCQHLWPTGWEKSKKWK